MCLYYWQTVLQIDALLVVGISPFPYSFLFFSFFAKTDSLIPKKEWYLVEAEKINLFRQTTRKFSPKKHCILKSVLRN